MLGVCRLRHVVGLRKSLFDDRLEHGEDMAVIRLVVAAVGDAIGVTEAHPEFMAEVEREAPPVVVKKIRICKIAGDVLLQRGLEGR